MVTSPSPFVHPGQRRTHQNDLCRRREETPSPLFLARPTGITLVPSISNSHISCTSLRVCSTAEHSACCPEMSPQGLIKELRGPAKLFSPKWKYESWNTKSPPACAELLAVGYRFCLGGGYHKTVHAALRCGASRKRNPKVQPSCDHLLFWAFVKADWLGVYQQNCFLGAPEAKLPAGSRKIVNAYNIYACCPNGQFVGQVLAVCWGLPRTLPRHAAASRVRCQYFLERVMPCCLAGVCHHFSHSSAACVGVSSNI